MIDFDLPTTDDIPDSRQCPKCGARHWLNYYATEEEEIGLACCVCGIHYRDEEASQWGGGDRLHSPQDNSRQSR